MIAADEGSGKMSLRGVRGLLYSIAFFSCISILLLRHHLSPPTTEPERLYNIMGKPLEKVNVDYKKNIHFSVKTSVKNYRTRLSLLMLTWFQAVEKDQLFIVSDNPTKDVEFVQAVRNAGYNLIPTDCKDSHKPLDLCCKTGYECGLYYEEMKKHKDRMERYQWFCHFDDDVYVNVQQLSNMLQKYDHNEPYYIGRWPTEAKENGQQFLEAGSKELQHVKELNYPIHTVKFQYATGSSRCMSYGMMMKAAEFFNYTTKYCQVALYSDDVSQGFIIEVVLGHELTNVDEIHGQFEDVSKASVDEMKKFVSISYRRRPGIDHLINHVSLPSKFPNDEPRFMAYHCLLYPQVSWCQDSD